MNKPLPLEGYRVIDMTEVWAGPFSTSQLGDLGAEIIRVESYPRVAQSRPAQAPPPNPNVPASLMAAQMVGPADAPRPWDRSTSYHMTNRNKLAICMNVLDPRGRELFLRLIGIADAFVIGYSAGTANQMGIDYETLIQYKPDLVMLSSVAWGERGPYQGYSTIGAGPDAWSGHHHLRAYPDQDAAQARQSVHIDASVSVTIAFAVLSALYYRAKTGKGQFIDLSMGEVLLNHLARPALDWVMNNRIDKPIGNVDPDCAPNGCYPCAEPDSWVVMVVRTDAQWRGLKQALGNPAWADDRRFDSVVGRIHSRAEIDAHLAEWTKTLTPYAVFERLQAVGVAASPMYNNDAPISDPHLVARGFYRWVTHPVTGQYRRPGPLYDMKETPIQFRRHTNLLGEHNHEVLCGLLGLNEAEYEALIEADIIGDAYDPAYSTDAADREERPAVPGR